MSPSPRKPTLAEAFTERLQQAWLTGGALSVALLPLSWVYRGALGLRALVARLRRQRREHLPVPVIIVGNWIVGGAGKTPTTLALLDLLAAHGLKAGVISRGYGRVGNAVLEVTPDSTAREAGDEPLLIHLRGRVPVAVGADRVAAARLLLAAHPKLQVLVSDDGLQHQRLPRQLSLLVFDERGLGNGRLLPAGPLRQLPAPLAADELVVYNARAPSTALPGFVATRKLGGAVSLADWWAGQPSRRDALLALRGLPGWVAVAGIARPQRFFDMLSAEGFEVDTVALADHANFTHLPWPAHAAGVLLTEKDAVKLHPERVGSVPVWVVTLDFRWDTGFDAALLSHLQRLLLA